MRGDSNAAYISKLTRTKDGKSRKVHSERAILFGPLKRISIGVKQAMVSAASRQTAG